MDWIVSVIKDLMNIRFTGNIRINFLDGKIKDIEEFKRTKAPE
jgi:hypothetical protein